MKVARLESIGQLSSNLAGLCIVILNTIPYSKELTFSQSSIRASMSAAKVDFSFSFLNNLPSGRGCFRIPSPS